jgi:general stress protein 26
MTAQLEGDEDHGPIWFFTARSTDLVRAIGGPRKGFFTFTDKAQSVWATVTGRLSLDNDRAVIDRLWSPFVAARYGRGKNDPGLMLPRFDPADAEIRLDGSGPVAGLGMLFGADPKTECQHNIAKGPLE